MTRYPILNVGLTTWKKIREAMIDEYRSGVSPRFTMRVRTTTQRRDLVARVSFIMTTSGVLDTDVRPRGNVRNPMRKKRRKRE